MKVLREELRVGNVDKVRELIGGDMQSTRGKDYKGIVRREFSAE
jgi:hypothetical protein